MRSVSSPLLQPASVAGAASSLRLTRVVFSLHRPRPRQHGSWCLKPPHEQHVRRPITPVSCSTWQSDPIISQ
ncbi:hypothetical protein NDU88_004235 [Pleurodeles waltl]|uniref:Uncharacterized protein n=1 Tax=Pleurodeles waltl TaxID=8319 RepID=A0AAV7TRA4_PLEWA|nr:hypothetical protein NDU88_004235 [Pleurodeles waltl]